MNLTAGDRFYSDKHQDHGTVVNYYNYKNWTFTLDKTPSKLRRARYSPNLVKWEKVGSMANA